MAMINFESQVPYAARADSVSTCESTLVESTDVGAACERDAEASNTAIALVSCILVEKSSRSEDVVGQVDVMK